MIESQTAPVGHLSLKELLPETEGYMTYEGSTTHPGCWETTVWIILNKPIYISAQELYALRRLMQGTDVTPKAPLGNNARPIQLLHHRTIRTNIDFRKEPRLSGFTLTSKPEYPIENSEPILLTIDLENLGSESYLRKKGPLKFQS
ncbi:hypothetical protein PV325_006372 [Microctonus aethiopoides]|nr:hypothetical protein PV325_006372 [Microctonus aethiopoides]